MFLVSNFVWLDLDSSINFGITFFGYFLLVISVFSYDYFRITRGFMLRSKTNSTAFRLKSLLIFFESCRSRVMTCRFNSGSLEPSSHFKSLICKIESMSNQMKFNIFLMSFCYQMVPSDLENSSQHCFCSFVTRWFRSESLMKAVFSFHFSSLLHSQSFPQVYPKLSVRNIAPCLSHPQQWPKKDMDLDWNLATF